MGRLLIVSNRLPVTIGKSRGKLVYKPSSGGLATGLNSLSDPADRLWIGWPGYSTSSTKERSQITGTLNADGLVPVFLSKREIEEFYAGFSNKVLWPHFHYFPQYTDFAHEEYWKTYREVNDKFARVVCDLLQPGDMVWVQDYQLMLLPALIRACAPEIPIGFFLHIPFPSYELFRQLPWRRQLLNGVLVANLIGFHTFGYMRHFLSAAYRITGHEHAFGQMIVDGRPVSVDVYPMSIDYAKFANCEPNPADEEVRAIHNIAAGNKIVLSVDRLDYSKGIPQRIRAIDQFLGGHPEHHGEVSFVMLVVPSRDTVDQYQELKHEVETLVGELNGQYATFDWTPIKYFYRSFSFDALNALYQRADVALITPLRDGMNLVAKEYVASKHHSEKGVLILSEMAGAAAELTEALLVNPLDLQELADCIDQALRMPEAEQRRRLKKMQHRLRRYTVEHWAKSFISDLKKTTMRSELPTGQRLSAAQRKAIKEQFCGAAQRLLVLDYDGTLMDFDPDPQAVAPDEQLLSLLERLSRGANTKVVINSGRDHITLENWLGHLPLEMAAEHGVWFRHDDTWTLSPGIENNWKDRVMEVLNDMVERTPGSFIEEKAYSLAWHYRQTDRELGDKRVREYRDTLRYLTANLNLQVLEGNKVIEIKNSGVNKGKAVAGWIDSGRYDFILVAGDDKTDEDMFAAAPADAVTLKVGRGDTDATYRVLSVREVREFLAELAECVSA